MKTSAKNTLLFRSHAALTDVFIIGLLQFAALEALFRLDILPAAREVTCLVLLIASALVGTMYELLSHLWQGETIGKKLCGLGVLNENTLSPPAIYVLVLRAIIKWGTLSVFLVQINDMSDGEQLINVYYPILSYFLQLIFVSSMFMMMLTPKKQAVHDFICSTVVEFTSVTPTKAN